MTQTHLLFQRRFWPIFCVQFIGAFNDNLLRSALVVMITYADAHALTLTLPMKPATLVSLCAALLVLPYVFFSPLAGALADRFEKRRLILWIKSIEIIVMLGAWVGFAQQQVPLLMILLFASGVHSAFFGPIKYSILPELLHKEELLAGNGLVAAGTYIAILLGLILGGLLAGYSPEMVGVALVMLSVLARGAGAWIISPQPAVKNQESKASLRQIWHLLRAEKSLLHAVGAIAWFLVQGSVFMGQFPNFAKLAVGGDASVYSMFLAIFSLGVALGAVLCSKLLRGQASMRLAVPCLLGMGLFTATMVMSVPLPMQPELLTATQLLADWRSVPMLASMLALSLCGGMFLVPMYAVLQSNSQAQTRSRVVAAANMLNSLGMTLAALACAAALQHGVTVSQIFMLMALANALMALRLMKKSI